MTSWPVGCTNGRLGACGIVSLLLASRCPLSSCLWISLPLPPRSPKNCALIEMDALNLVHIHIGSLEWLRRTVKKCLNLLANLKKNRCQTMIDLWSHYLIEGGWFSHLPLPCSLRLLVIQSVTETNSLPPPNVLVSCQPPPPPKFLPRNFSPRPVPTDVSHWLLCPCPGLCPLISIIFRYSPQDPYFWQQNPDQQYDRNSDVCDL